MVLLNGLGGTKWSSHSRNGSRNEKQLNPLKCHYFLYCSGKSIYVMFMGKFKASFITQSAMC